MLADWGAEVVHVEHPDRADGYRGTTALAQTGAAAAPAGFNYSFELINRNKKGMAINLGHERGREILHRLVRTADVFLSNLRPYELDRFGLQYQALSELNPGLVYAIVTGYGRQGPDKDSPAYDFSAFWTRAGIAATLAEPGGPPPWSRPGFGDHITGIALACGIAMALFVRQRTGVGQEVDVSLMGTGIWALSSDIQGALISRQEPSQLPREDRPNPLVNYYQASDGKWLILTMPQSDPYWPSFCRAIERPDLEYDSKFDSLQSRSQNRAALIGILDEVFARKTCEGWKKVLSQFGLIYAPAQSVTEVIADPQATSDACFVDFEHPAYGPVKLIANPIKLSKTPALIETPAPQAGQHTEELLLGLGYDWQAIAALKEQRVIL